MPELPEVETVVRSLRQPLIGRTVTRMWYDWPRTLRTPGPDEFAARIIGQTFRSVDRRAKYIVCALDQELLIVHLKMTGRLYVVGADEQHEADRWVHFRLGLDNGHELRFSDARKFGRVYLAQELIQITPALGPEPLTDDFTEGVFRDRLRGRHKNIKALLLDQGFIAGVGNIYADESLFRANIHPLRRANDLTDAEIARLYETVRAALNDGIDHEGASIHWYRKPDGTKGSSQEHFFVYGRDGQPCAVCGSIIQKTRVAQRGTHYCPSCQEIGERPV
jgi:formamidopyrimidine-DNA glycosylase